MGLWMLWSVAPPLEHLLLIRFQWNEVQIFMVCLLMALVFHWLKCYFNPESQVVTTHILLIERWHVMIVFTEFLSQIEGRLLWAAARYFPPWSPNLVVVEANEADWMKRMNMMKIGQRWGGGGIRNSSMNILKETITSKKDSSQMWS